MNDGHASLHSSGQNNNQARYQLINEQSAAGNYLAGLYAQNNNDWKKASLYLDNVLSQNPGNTDLIKRAMILAMGGGDVERAIKHARSLEKAGEADVLANLFLSMEAIKNNDTKTARTYLNALPEGGVAEFVQPLIQSWLEPENKTYLETLSNGNVIHLYHSYLILDYLGEESPSLSLLDKFDVDVLEKEGISTYSLEKVADIYARFNRKDKALDLYKKIQSISPENKRIADKITSLEKDGHLATIEIHPLIETPQKGVAKALFDIATLIYQDLNDDSSRIFSYMALYLDPTLSDAHILLAHIKTSDKRYDEAIKHYKAASANGSELQIAALLEESERYDEAISVLKTYVDKENSIDAQIQIGDLYRRQENLRKALRAYNKAANMIGEEEIPEEYWPLLYARGMVYEQLKEWDKAEQDLKQALSYQPDHPYILNYLGYSWADQGVNLDQALAMITKAHNLRPDDGYIADSLGWVLYQMERYDDAVSPMEKAVQILSYDPTINDHLGDVYWQVGRHIEARFQWRKAINHSDSKALSDSIRDKLKNGLENKPQNTKEKKMSFSD